MKNLYLFFLKYILSIIFAFNLTYAQDKQVRFDRFSTRDGLSQNRIFDPHHGPEVVDRQGRMEGRKNRRP